jgi:hypothetical protein
MQVTSRASVMRLAPVLAAITITAIGSQIMDNVKGIWLFQSADQSNAAPPLDSFSSSSVALAVLNRELQQILFSYVQERDQGGVIKRPKADGPMLASSVAQPEVSATRRKLPGPCPHEIARMARLRFAVAGLKAEFDERWLWICSENGSSEDFLNAYLMLMTEAPASVDIVGWLPQAIHCAQKCGRTDELTDALTHLVRFHPTLNRARAVDDWLRRNGQGLKSLVLPVRP